MVGATQGLGDPRTAPRSRLGIDLAETSRDGGYADRVAGALPGGGEASLKSRETDVDDEQNRRLKSAVASLCLDNELLREKIARLENGRPLTGWKSRL